MDKARSFRRQEPNARKAFEINPQGTAMEFTFYVQSVDGRRIEGVPWSDYGGFDWNNDGEIEVLRILFRGQVPRVVTIKGNRMERAIRALQDCTLRGVRILNEREVEAWEAFNQDADTDAEGIVKSAEFEPKTFEEVIQLTQQQEAANEAGY